LLEKIELSDKQQKIIEKLKK